MTPQDAPAGRPDLVLLDRESDNQDVTIREGFGGRDRVVIACGFGDDEDGGSVAVALDPDDVDRAIAWLTAWRAEHRG